MAFNVKGITIEINGDASGLEKALRSVKAETQGIDKQMSKVAKAMKSGFNSSATQASLFINQQGLMQNKYANLSKQLSTYNQALSVTKQCYQENLKAFGEYDERTLAAAQNIEYLESQTAILRSQMDTLASSMLTCSADGMLFYNTLGNVATKANQVAETLKPISMIATGALVGAVETAISFEDAWTGVLKTVNGTPQQLERVNSGLKDLALNTASSYESLAGFAELGGQMGVATDDIVTFTKTIAMLGDTTNIAGEEAAKALAQIANVMVDASERTSDYYERFGSTVVDLGNNFATTEADIVAMSQRLATAGRQVGMSTPEVMALATALGSMGIKAAEGGGSISKLMKEIQMAVSTGNDDLEKFASTAGMSAQEFATAWRDDAGQAFAQFLEGIGKSEDVTAKLAELGIEEIRMSNATGALAQSTDVYTSALDRANTAWSENTAMVAEAEKRYGTLKTTISQAWEAIKQMADELGQAFAPTVKSIAEGVKSLAESFSALSPETKQTVANLLALTAVASPTAKGISKLASGGQSVMKALFGVSDGASAFATALGIGEKATKESTKYMSSYAKATLEASASSGQTTASVAGLASAFGISLPAIMGVVGGLAAVVGVTGLAYMAGENYKKSLIEQAKEASGANYANLQLLETSKQYTQEASQHIEASQQIAREYEANARQADQLASRILYLNGIESLNETQKTLLKQAVEELNQIYPELDFSIDENTGHIKQNTDELKINLEEAKKNAKEKAMLAAAQETYNAIMKEKAAYDDAKSSLQYWNNEVRDSSQAYTEAAQKYAQRSAEVIEASDRYSQAQASQSLAQDAFNQSLEEGSYSWELYLSQMNQAGGEASVFNETLQVAMMEAIHSAEEAGVQIPESLRNGIQERSMDPVAAIQEMSAIMDYTDMLASAGEAGLNIDMNLANAILANSSSPQEAANQLSKLIEFENAITEANLQGREISENLAVGVITGQVSLNDALNSIRNDAQSKFDDLDLGPQGQRIMQSLTSGIEASAGAPVNAMSKIGNPLQGAIKGWNLSQITKSEGTKASKSLDSAMNPAIPNSAKNAIQGAGNAFGGSGFPSIVANIASSAANAFANGIASIPRSAQNAYNQTKSIIDQIQSLTSRTYTVKVTKEVTTVEKKETKEGQRIAPRQMLSLMSDTPTSESQAQTFGLDRSTLLYANNASNPVVSAVQEALGLTSGQIAYNGLLGLSELASKIDTLIKISSTESMEGYLKTIAENSVKSIYMDKREVGKVLASPINEYNDMNNKFRRKISGER